MEVARRGISRKANWRSPDVISPGSYPVPGDHHWSSCRGAFCKTAIRRFEPARRLHMFLLQSQSFSPHVPLALTPNPGHIREDLPPTDVPRRGRCGPCADVIAPLKSLRPETPSGPVCRASRASNVADSIVQRVLVPRPWQQPGFLGGLNFEGGRTRLDFPREAAVGLPSFGGSSWMAGPTIRPRRSGLRK